MNKFQKIRKEMGLTLKQVSDLYCIPYRTVQNWEYGINNPPEYVLKMICVLNKAGLCLGGKNDSKGII